MITQRVYTSIRKMSIYDDVDAIFNSKIIGRLLKSIISKNGEKYLAIYETMGEVIDSIIDGSFFNNISLTKKQRQDIIDYLKDVGVIEYLENNSKRYNKTMKDLAEQKAAKAAAAEQAILKRRAEAKEKRINSQINLQQ